MDKEYKFSSTYDQYKGLVKRTMQLDDRDSQIHNAILGLVGELSELHDACLGKEKDDIKDEVGDVFWYFVSLTTLLDVDFFNSEHYDEILKEYNSVDTIIDNDFKFIYFNCFKNAGFLAEYLKKHILFGKEFKKDQFTKAVINLWISLNLLLKKFDLFFFEVYSRNDIKLRDRYPDSFK